uniref:Uncharacterized protein n=1 Tax=Arundo donax TaxID=35708 RepID=A0A0A8ZSP2_ARUDO
MGSRSSTSSTATPP